MHPKRPQTLTIPALLLALLTTSCAAPRLSQFQTFALAGRQYTEVVDTISEEAGRAAIDADSQVLLQTRNSLTEEDRREVYVQHTEALKSFLGELTHFRKHSGLLQRYFVALEQLATSDAPATIGTSTQDLVTRLQDLRPSLQEATVAGLPVLDYVAPAVTLSVASFREQALERELRQHAAVIERELDLQRAFLSALVAGLEADLRALAQGKEHDLVAEPYVSDGKLAKSWPDARRAVLMWEAELDTAQRAQEAADTLHGVFLALVENKATPADMSTLSQNIEALANMIRVIQGGDK